VRPLGEWTRHIGIDLGKTVFHLVGLNLRGEVIVRKKCSRKQLLHFTVNLKVRLIGMEACGGSHFLGRALREQGQEVRLIPAQYAKPYVKTNKSDYIDAEAIAEAVGRKMNRVVFHVSSDQGGLTSFASNCSSTFEREGEYCVKTKSCSFAPPCFVGRGD
jgi:transposase